MAAEGRSLWDLAPHLVAAGISIPQIAASWLAAPWELCWGLHSTVLSKTNRQG